MSENTDLRYSIAGFKMVLRRSVKPFIINVYLPTSLLVAVSFIGFLIPADMVPGRMALIVTTFLMLVNIENSHRKDGPKVRVNAAFKQVCSNIEMQAKAVTALDVWLLICVTFVAMALFEYAALLKIRFHRTRNVKVAASRKGKAPRMIAEFADETVATEANALCATIDKMALVVFVAMFLLASFIYWLSYRL